MIRIQILLIFTIILPSITTRFQDQTDHLSKTEQENILKTFLSTLSRNDLTNIDQNWCCKIDPGVEAISRTRQTTFYVYKVFHLLHHFIFSHIGHKKWPP
jgi:hypothetical protein